MGDDVAAKLLEMAEEYRTKAEDADDDYRSMPPHIADKQRRK
jgi:hypothetical protein